ncbi:metallophosphoesterase [Solibacillus sp. CAU 1738]|uniref:metallophosphoesterase n=1 Tax=Solibacillus sp. CAU 1738 TaxID=3140363 RepID=UPI003261C2C6
MPILIGIIVVIIYSAITFYIGWNINAWLVSWSVHIPNLLFWSLLFAVSFGFVLGRLHEWLRPLSVIGSYWMFVLQYGIALSVIANLFVFFTPLSVRLVGSVALLLFIMLFIIGSYNAYSPVVRELTINMDIDEPMTVVVGSDFHLGVLSDKGHLQKFVDLSNEYNPDVVLLVGDLVDDDPLWFVEKGMGEVMSQLKSTYGVYGVLGNHEYYGKKIPLLVEEMKQANVKILLDETILVGERFYLTGQEDITNKNRLGLEQLAPEQKDFPWIVMNHTPNDLQTPANAGVDLHLSGHTHLGQMWPNHLITGKMFEVDYGYKKKDDMHTLVSSGFGFWGPPTRIGSRSEMWVVHIKSDGQ